MLMVWDHPIISDEKYTTAMISWWEGGLHFFEKAPKDVESTTILGVYYFSYFMVFFIGWFFFRHWVKKGSIALPKREITDLGIYTLLGVMIGSKLAYVLFYNFEYYLRNPADIILNWSGMASHGAFIGVTVAVFLFAKRFKRSALELFDHCAIVGALGPIFIRSANFLNGELYGKSMDGDSSIATRFPMRDGEGRELFSKVKRSGEDWVPADQDAGEAGAKVYARVQFEDGKKLDSGDQYLVEVEAHHDWELIGADSYLGEAGTMRVKNAEGKFEQLPMAVQRIVTDPSHPSQIYQLGVSGILLLLLLLLIKKRAKFKGTVFGAFLTLYGLSRILMEFFRQQDYQRSSGLFRYVSMGQLLSLALIGGGVWMLAYARKGQEVVSTPPKEDLEPELDESTEAPEEGSDMGTPAESP